MGFSKLSAKDRIKRLIETGIFIKEDFLKLNNKNLVSKELANNLIENCIGFFQIPLGVALNYVIDGKDYIIPMAVEETSIIAAASKTAKWVCENGEIVTENLGWLGIGQIQIPKVTNYNAFKKIIELNKNDLLNSVNHNVASRMTLRGGGAKDLQVKSLMRKDGQQMAVIHMLVNTCDAMGANTINQMSEYLKIHIEKLTHEKVGLCILSNLVDTKLTRASIIIKNIDPDLGGAIEEASVFAELDPYRAATSNKGVMNAIDGLLIATGNDWRAVEAGIHAYAAQSGQYKPITHWYMDRNNLHGELTAPIDVGIVGGVTRLHPTAQICLKILRIEAAAELAKIVAAVGLVQNLAALRALVTGGIVQGHMLLHINNLISNLDLSKQEYSIVKQKLAMRLATKKSITGEDINEIITSLRKKDTTY